MLKKGEEDGIKDVSVAVAIDKDKSSQYALKWAVDNLLGRGQPLTLIHIKTRASSLSHSHAAGDQHEVYARAYRQQLEQANKELFMPFRCFCTKKEIRCKEVIYEDHDVSKGIVEYVASNNIEILVLGAGSKGGLFRFKTSDIPGSVLKSVPSYCTVYIISKSKISNVKQATTPVPYKKSATPSSPSNSQPNSPQQNRNDQARYFQNQVPRGADRNLPMSRFEDYDIRSPFNRAGGGGNRSYERSNVDNDISFVSSNRPSIDNQSAVYFDSVEGGRLSSGSEFDVRSIDNMSSISSATTRSIDINAIQMSMDLAMSDTSSILRMSMSSDKQEDLEAEMRRLRLELKQTIDMYSNACKEALTAKEKAEELHRWKMEEEQKLVEARIAGEAAMEIAEREKAKCKAALEAAEAAKKIAEREAQKRITAENKALKEAEERKKIMNSMGSNEGRYRRYTIEEIEMATENFASSRKIGEGGYGPVYKCQLDHTPTAIKVLRPDAAQGRSQFQQEVEILCSIRHPNMVLLLGACPEYGCLVYEYMSNGSLEDRLFRRGNTPTIPWQVRFRIAAEIGTGLLFLHQTKPEPLVHRDLKPANILLDRNYVSKISDVGLARLVPPSVANAVTQYRMTSTAGTFCYIDPEYQQTGMLGIKSDIYSFGILLLQIITAKPPMGLTHVIEGAIERGNFAEVLDRTVPDWPVDETLKFAKLALKCAELRRKDRPNLATVVLPELDRWRLLGEASMPNLPHYMGGLGPHNPSSARPSQEMLSGPPNSGLDASAAAPLGER